MLNKKSYLQLFVEYEKRNVHIDIHPEDFSKENVQAIFKDYVEKYKGKEINHLFLRFWERSIAGDYLSFIRKNNFDALLIKPLAGFKYIKGKYNYLRTSADIGGVSVIA